MRNSSTRLVLAVLQLIVGLLALLVFIASVKNGVSSMNPLFAIAIAVLGFTLGTKEMIFLYKRK